jgi:hypothetical protein
MKNLALSNPVEDYYLKNMDILNEYYRKQDSGMTQTKLFQQGHQYVYEVFSCRYLPGPRNIKVPHVSKCMMNTFNA